MEVLMGTLSPYRTCFFLIVVGVLSFACGADIEGVSSSDHELGENPDVMTDAVLQDTTSSEVDATSALDASDTFDATEASQDVPLTTDGEVSEEIDVVPPDPPLQYTPCGVADCWSQLSFSSVCGVSTLNEDFGSGRYNVHNFTLDVRAEVTVELTLTPTGGAFEPALILHDAAGHTVYDGARGIVSESLNIEVIDDGRRAGPARVQILSAEDTQLSVFITSWRVIDGDFAPRIDTDVAYTFAVSHDCEPPVGELLSSPNFDLGDVEGGFYLMPESDPPGLYTRKADDCSRGTQLLIDVLYTVAFEWNQLRPEYSPIALRDLNEGSCSGVDHATHDDGTHVDIVVSCATQISCDDIQPAVDLARLFVDTGEVCGIIFNDAAVQAIVNPYFESLYSYEPWRGTFMRTVSGHTGHFHVRVKKPDGTCN